MASLGACAELTGETLGGHDYSVWVDAREVLDGDFDVPARDYLDGAYIPLTELPLGAISRVRFERSGGPGRMYHGLSLRCITPALGDVVRVQVSIVAPHDRLFVLAEDFLPAGFSRPNFDGTPSRRRRRSAGCPT